MEKDLLIRHFHNLPSQQEFATLENTNVPALLKGCVKTWPAFHLWNPSKGGLSRLNHLAGTATVQVMASSSGPNFYGNIRNHERIPLQFASFLNLIKGEESELAVYLAQAGIFSRESAVPSPLRGLLQDIETPTFLRASVAAINLWMSVSGSRSSTHYDPFHNLLCVVSGSKEVKLWPPSCAPSLYPLAVSGEASNHSGVDFADPDLARFPRFREAMARCQSVTLRAGDALFLPEGWFHQVDSEGVTVAVNLWWPSEVALKLGTHMDAYLLRRVVANLVDSEKEMIVGEFRRSVSGGAAHVSDVRKPVKDHVKKPASDVKEPVTDVVEEPCVAKSGKFLVASGKCAVASGKFDGAPDTFVGTAGNFVGASINGEFVDASVNVQNAEGSRKKKSKRDRRRSKVRALKVAQDSSEVDHLRASNASPSEDIGDPNMAQKYSATSLSNAEVQALRTLIVCVSDMMMNTSDNTLENTSQKLEDTSQGLEDTSQKLEDTSQGLEDASQVLGHDTSEGFRHETVAAVLASLEAPSLQRILLVMSVEYPRTLEATILHKLSPLGCEVLTRRFEEMDADPGLECPQEDFYAQIYSVFDDPGMAMAALVDGKEALAALALQRVLDGNLGISCTLKA